MKGSVRTKFRLIFAALALGPLILLGLLVIRNSYVSGFEQASLELANTTGMASTRVAGFFKSINEHLYIFLDVADLEVMDRSHRDEALSMLLSHKHKNHASLFAEILLVIPDGQVLGCASLYGDCVTRGQTFEDTAFLKEDLPRLSLDQACYGSVLFDPESGEPRMRVALPVMQVRTGKPWAVLLAEIRLKEMWHVIDQIHAGPGGVIYMTDGNRIVAHADPSVVLRGTGFTLPPSSEKIVPGLHGDEVVMASEAVPFGNRVFHVITEKSLRAVLMPTYALIWKLGIVFALALAAVVLMGLMTQRLIVNPLEILARKARKIEAGDLGEQLELDRTDEFGELAQSINAMSQSLKKTIRSLEKENMERMQKETALYEEKRFKDSLIESMPGVFYHFDGNGKFLSWNKNLEKVSGLSADEISRANPIQLFDAEEGKRVAESIEEVFRVGEATIEASFLSRDGRRIPFHLTGRRFDMGERMDLVGVGIDISKRLQAQESLERTMIELTRTNKELEHLTFATSHHLQEPLRKVRTFGDRLKNGYSNELGQKGKDYIDRMQRSTDRMQKMLNGLLLFSRIRSGSLSWVTVDMGRLVRDVALELEEDRYKGLEGSVEIGDLPLLEGDPLRIATLFRHLTDNAFKFRRDGVSPVVRIFAREIDGRCRISIEDNGIGFDEKYKDRIFEPFQRLHSMGRYEGVGIGLSICRRIAEAHGGDITASSKPGVGSTFVVDFPEERLTKDD